jgi:GMP synthase-like glutamine amidotransferase
MARALVLRHHVEDNPGLIGEAFSARGFELTIVIVDEQHPAPAVDGFDALVVLGSKSSVYDPLTQAAWFGGELELIGEADRAGVPILGICFGAQALCHYFGGDVTRAAQGEVGWFDVEVLPGRELSSGPWFEYHYDHCTLPEGADVWATSPRAVQAFSIGQHLGVQFHPEIDEPQLRDWLESDEDDARALNIDLDALLEQTANETPRARERAVELVDAFLRRARTLAP